MTWTIKGRPGEAPVEEDAEMKNWLWELENDQGETKRVIVEVLGVGENMSDEMRQACQTDGKSVVEEMLDRDELPGWVTLKPDGRDER
jgi:hypothetical protein